jgi:hypothetical protein
MYNFTQIILHIIIRFTAEFIYYELFRYVIIYLLYIYKNELIVLSKFKFIFNY